MPSPSELMRQDLETEQSERRRTEPAQIVLVNGPPRSGKDTVGRLLQEFYPGKVYVTKMAKALKERTHALYGLFDLKGAPLEHDFFEQCKDYANDMFLGISPRQAYINVSELLMKPVHGQDIWGEMLIEDIALHGNDADLVVVTDSGFAEEAIPVIQMFGRGNSTLLQLSRNGTSFASDSRSYIQLDGIIPFWLPNNGTEFDLVGHLATVLKFQIGYQVEVQLPGPRQDLIWFEQGGKRPTLEQALAAIESLRGEYGTRVMRVMAGNRAVKMVMPGDPPVVELS